MYGRSDEAWSVIAWMVSAKKLQDMRNPLAAVLCIFAAGAAFAELLDHWREQV